MNITGLSQPMIPSDRAADLTAELAAGVTEAAETVSRTEIFNGYVGVFVAAFATTVLATPIMRRLAVANGIIDSPSDPRKVHKIPIAYLGGTAIFLGLVAAVFYSILADEWPDVRRGLEFRLARHRPGD